jgi:hypothetical protein
MEILEKELHGLTNRTNSAGQTSSSASSCAASPGGKGKTGNLFGVLSWLYFVSFSQRCTSLNILYRKVKEKMQPQWFAEHGGYHKNKH